MYLITLMNEIASKSSLFPFNIKSSESPATEYSKCSKCTVTRAMNKKLEKDWARAAKEGLRVLMNLMVDFLAHGPRLGPLIFVQIRLGFHYFWSLYLGLHNVGSIS